MIHTKAPRNRTQNINSLNGLSLWCVGDSLMQGDINYRGGYDLMWSGGLRTELYLRSQAAGYQWSFVGSKNTYAARDLTAPPPGWFGDLPQAYANCDAWGLTGVGASIEANAAVLAINLPALGLTPTVLFNLAVIHIGTLDIVHGYNVDSGGQPGTVVDPAYGMDALADRIISIAKTAHEFGFNCPVVVCTLPPVVNKVAAVNYQNGLLRAAAALYPWIILCDSGPLINVSTGLSDGFNLTASSYKTIGDTCYTSIINGYSSAALNS